MPMTRILNQTYQIIQTANGRTARKTPNDILIKPSATINAPKMP